jgi:uncharacterized protein (DUF1786 family)
MKIEKHLDWKDPRIYYEDKSFEIDISKNEIEITCCWDHGWSGRGSERIFIPIEIMEKLIKEIKGE